MLNYKCGNMKNSKKSSKKQLKEKIVVILLGPPGAGKGTQANLLADKLSFYYLETSKIIENAFKEGGKDDFVKVGGKKYFLKDEKEKWEKGALCSLPFFIGLMKKKIGKIHEIDESLILAGSPRTLDEAKIVIPLLEKLYGKKNIKFVLIKLSAEMSIYRNSHRRICRLMRHPIIYNKETSRLTKCPLDGSKLMRRKGLDSPETIKIRLKEYKERTYPLIESFREKGFKVKEISGAGSVSKVFREVLKAIGV